MDSINPATGQLIRSYPDHDDASIDKVLDRSRRAFLDWRHSSWGERRARLQVVAQALRDEARSLARLATLEMGKPLSAAIAEVEKCAWACEHFAEHGERYLAPEGIATDATRSVVRCEPLGVVLAVMPWNFPFWQVFRCAAPALVAGNTVVLKHASNVPGCSLAIEQVFRGAGFPDGAFRSLLVPSARAERLVSDPRIAAVSVTGSDLAGARVAEAAGRAIKKVVLELGGSDAFLVLADADVENAAVQAAAARCINNGESCIAAKRFIVEEPIAERFEHGLVEAMRAMAIGDPMAPATQIGPLARADLVEMIEQQARRSVEMGAMLALGGTRLDRPGFYFPPTVLTHVEPGMPAFDEETFGPLAAVTRARDAEHAVELANRSRYGLGASIWTADAEHGERLAEAIEAGAVFVNGPVKSDPRLPFGGVKRSGFGRELAAAGAREFVNLKTVWRA